ncbi:MAG: phage terminase large subunit family protein [Candidatus Devosia phytovorans]|uniref:Phage terminase large subunit family protein n=1 Tax=Candidatus Devosia phytovorans TaxID=3121372 RepID=A0AAJ6B1K9_9HYPH|nr:terminase gpA endonuclease subunit [Devosia sp.]WEK04553.1 MAG: phage terminase large subunit family protein [Devosia sp.]
MNFHPGAHHIVASKLADAIRPVPPLPFRKWLPKNIVLVDGPKKGELWSELDAPYLGPIAEVLDVDHPSNLVSIRKSQQTGVSILGLAWSLYLAEIAPDNILYAVPGIDALQDVNGKKLQPMIEAWQDRSGKKIILPTVARSGSGSTTYEKRFVGGSLSLANANSVMDLSSNTSRYGVKDEVSKWQNSPNGDDPEVLFFGRFTAFRRLKLWKILELSTPELDSGDPLGDEPGHCRIDRSFRRSDQRFWNIKCPECGNEFVQTILGFVINKAHPHLSTYECPHCEHHVSEMERVPAVRAGRFIPTSEGHPGFHVDAFISLMMSYEAIAEEWLDRQNKGEEGAKGFTNLVGGLPYAMKGDAPDHKRLLERRESYHRGVVPADGLILTAGADVHHNNIMVETVAFGQDRQSWSVEVAYLDGPTDDINAGAWLKLDEYFRTPVRDAFGQDRRIEALGVDSGDGLRTTQVYSWCANRVGTHAIKGMQGRGVPAIGLPQKVSVRKSGKRQKVGAAKVWPVGTWTLKGELMGNLHKEIVRDDGRTIVPGGYCHFADWHDESYFKQLTAEYFQRKLVKGKPHEGWDKLRRENHWLDVRVYAMAMAELLGISKLTADGWASLRALWQPTEPIDLLSSVTAIIAAEPNAPTIVVAVPQQVPVEATNIEESRKAWKRR